MHQLHRSFVLGGTDDERALWIDRDGVHAVEQYVLAKYYLTTMVYRHQVRLITDQMITRAIVLGIEHDKNTELRDVFAYDGSQQFLDRYVQWDDAKFLVRFGQDAESEAGSSAMLRRLIERRLLKQVFSARILDFDATVRERLSQFSKPEFDAPREQLEKEIAELIRDYTKAEIDPRFVIVFGFDIRSVRASSRDDEGSIMVDCSPKPRTFEEESSLFASINERYSDGYVEVYAPVTWNDHTERKKLRSQLRSSIRKLLLEKCAGDQTDKGEAS